MFLSKKRKQNNFEQRAYKEQFCANKAYKEQICAKKCTKNNFSQKKAKTNNLHKKLKRNTFAQKKILEIKNTKTFCFILQKKCLQQTMCLQVQRVHRVQIMLFSSKYLTLQVILHSCTKIRVKYTLCKNTQTKMTVIFKMDFKK